MVAIVIYTVYQPFGLMMMMIVMSTMEFFLMNESCRTARLVLFNGYVFSSNQVWFHPDCLCVTMRWDFIYIYLFTLFFSFGDLVWCSRSCDRSPLAFLVRGTLCAFTWCMTKQQNLRSSRKLDPWFEPSINIMNQAANTSDRPDALATITVRVVKSFSYRTVKNHVFKDLDLSSTTVGQLMQMVKECKDLEAFD